jgi:formate dehydrogenase major subunit
LAAENPALLLELAQLREVVEALRASVAELRARLGQDSHGPDAVAAISDARVTNEENYLLQKLMRSGDRHQQRRQLLPAVPRTVRGRFGGRVWLDGGTGSFDDLDRADCILSGLGRIRPRRIPWSAPG